MTISGPVEGEAASEAWDCVDPSFERWHRSSRLWTTTCHCDLWKLQVSRLILCVECILMITSGTATLCCGEPQCWRSPASTWRKTWARVSEKSGQTSPSKNQLRSRFSFENIFRFMRAWKKQNPDSYCHLQFDKLYIDNRLYVWDKESGEVIMPDSDVGLTLLLDPGCWTRERPRVKKVKYRLSPSLKSFQVEHHTHRLNWKTLFWNYTKCTPPLQA